MPIKFAFFTSRPVLSGKLLTERFGTGAEAIPAHEALFWEKTFMMNTKSLALAALGLALTSSAGAQTATLKLLETGGMQKAGYYVPQRLTLSKDKPAEIKKEPTFTATPMYGTLNFAGGKYLVALDESEDAATGKLYVDSNGDGDLTNDGSINWERSERKITNSQTKEEFLDVLYRGDSGVMPKGKKHGLSFYRFAGKGGERRGLGSNILFYYRDYGMTGDLKIGKKSYPIVMVDETATGIYDNTAERKASLLIDRDLNGKFDGRYERYDLSKPFNLGGTVYEVGSISADGTKLTLKKSAKTPAEVAEVPIPADLSVGKTAVAFSRPVIGGKTVKFPEDYKGKIVMLDFWATWCGPCIAELPGLTKTYEKYHGKGFEILGISLDRADQLEKVQAFLKEKKMPWEQVYDGKFWDAEIGKLYGVDSIPRAFLVDGSTGKILATTNELRGENLDSTIARHLSSLTGVGSAEKEKGSK
jgi:thiol-disulfide isomerase/thioredoxin